MPGVTGASKARRASRMGWKSAGPVGSWAEDFGAGDRGAAGGREFTSSPSTLRAGPLESGAEVGPASGGPIRAQRFAPEAVPARATDVR